MNRIPVPAPATMFTGAGWAPTYRRRSGHRPVPLLIANLISSGAAVLMNIATAAYLKQSTGSAVYAAAAIVVAYLPPLFVGPRLGFLIDRHLSRRGILLAEGTTGITSILCGVAVACSVPLPIVLVGTAIRSILVASVRYSLMRWLKLETEPGMQARRMQYFTLTILLALPFSGVAMGLAPLVSDRDMIGILLIAAASHLAAMAVMAALSALPQAIDGGQSGGTLSVNARVGMISTVREITGDRRIAPYFFACLFAQPVFQAAEQVLVSVKGQSLGASGTAQMQTFGGLGLLLGFALLQGLRGRATGRARSTTLLLIASGIGAMVATSHASRAGVVLPSFLCMTLAYELIDMYCFSKFFELAPAIDVARYSITLRTLGGALMALSALTLGGAFDVVGFASGSLVYAVGAAGYGLLLVVLRRSARETHISKTSITHYPTGD